MTITFDANYVLTVGGQPVTTEATFDAYDPATGEVFAAVPDAGAAELDDAVAAARAAFPGWAATPLADRQAALLGMAGTLMEHKEGLAALLTREQGKPLDQAREEIDAAAFWCAEFARMEIADEILEESEEVTVRVRHVPIGVVGGIVPWNFPVVLAFWKIAPALLAGNTLVLKPSPFTPLTTLKIGELVSGLLPPGVMNVLSGGDALGPRMSEHPGIDKISFTGSTATGRKVMASAAANLKRLTLELGGNDAGIVLPDVDVKALAPKLFWGAFANNAQFCLALKRLYLHASIYDEMRDELVRLARETPMGPGNQQGVALGPVQNRLQFERLKSLLQDCRENGYEILCGGEIGEGAGYFFPVTLVDNPPDDARVVVEEPFGPILPLLKYDSIDEVVARANASEFGLGGSVWTGDAAQGEAIAERLQTGTVWVNEIHSILPSKPMAGHKQSGVGVENGQLGLYEYTIPQTLTIRKRG